MYTKITPLFDRVVLEMQTEDDSSSLIKKPDKFKLPSNEGVVVEVGAGRYENGHLVPMTVKVNDVCLVAEMRGVDFVVDGKTLRIVEESAVMAIIERSSLVQPS